MHIIPYIMKKILAPIIRMKRDTFAGPDLILRKHVSEVVKEPVLILLATHHYSVREGGADNTAVGQNSLSIGASCLCLQRPRPWKVGNPVISNGFCQLWV
jgi:hypothetical protein